MLSFDDRLFVSSLAKAAFVKAAEDENKPLQGWQQVIPAAVLGGTGALYGATQSPGGSPLRGALVGGMAGAGTGAGLAGMHQFLTSPYGGQFQNSAGKTALLLGAMGLGGYGGLQAGRKGADKLGLPDKNKDDELSELDLIHKGRGWLPTELSGFFGAGKH